MLRVALGLVIGLAVGVPAGWVIGMLVLPPYSPQQSAATSLQVLELTRRLESMNKNTEVLDQHIGRFQQVAEEMQTSFQQLESQCKSIAVRPARARPAPQAAEQQPPGLPPAPPYQEKDVEAGAPSPDTAAPAGDYPEPFYRRSQ